MGPRRCICEGGPYILAGLVGKDIGKPASLRDLLGLLVRLISSPRRNREPLTANGRAPSYIAVTESRFLPGTSLMAPLSGRTNAPGRMPRPRSYGPVPSGRCVQTSMRGIFLLFRPVGGRLLVGGYAWPPATKAAPYCPTAWNCAPHGLGLLLPLRDAK